MNTYHNILLCVAGGTPQIITETLWALKEKGERVDEIRVITTKEGRDKILTGKINGRGAADESLLDPDAGQFYRFLRDFPEAEPIHFDANSLYLLTNKESGEPSPRDRDEDRLSDILTDDDNEKAANQICEIVRKLTADARNRIHASIAGGRKTMSLYLMAAMQLFGRNHDVMSHVLVSRGVEFGAPKFFYKTPQPTPILDPAGKPKMKDDGSELMTEDVAIHLAEIPFTRLRGVLRDWLRDWPREPPASFGEIVTRTQEELNLQDAAQELRLTCKNKTVVLLNQRAKLTEREFFFYLLFARARKLGRGADGFIRLNEISYEALDETFRLISRARGNECGVAEYDALPRFDKFMPGLLRDIQKQDFESLQTTLTEVVSKIKGKLEQNKLPKPCWVSTSGERGQLRYGLRVAPERICWQ